jgi:hypothetical protein
VQVTMRELTLSSQCSADSVRNSYQRGMSCRWNWLPSSPTSLSPKSIALPTRVRTCALSMTVEERVSVHTSGMSAPVIVRSYPTLIFIDDDGTMYRFEKGDRNLHGLLEFAADYKTRGVAQPRKFVFKTGVKFVDANWYVL